MIHGECVFNTRGGIHLAVLFYIGPLKSATNIVIAASRIPTMLSFHVPIAIVGASRLTAARVASDKRTPFMEVEKAVLLE